MISNLKKNQEKMKLSDKFQQPSAGPADSMGTLLSRMNKRQKVNKKKKK